MKYLVTMKVEGTSPPNSISHVLKSVGYFVNDFEVEEIEDPEFAIQVGLRGDHAAWKESYWLSEYAETGSMFSDAEQPEETFEFEADAVQCLAALFYIEIQDGNYDSLDDYQFRIVEV